MASWEEVSYGGWPHCLRRVENGLELVVTLDVGPRIIRCGFEGGANLFHEFPEQLGKMNGTSWMSFGGHRLWHAPEVFPRTYAPDFDLVRHQQKNGVLSLATKTEPSTGLSKRLEIAFEDGRVVVSHRLINHNPWAIRVSPWCLSVMAGGGVAVVPQEDSFPHPDVLTPARPLVLWHFTKMNDPRFTWGESFIRLREDPQVPGKQKFGVRNTKGWAGYFNQGSLFLKTVPFDPNAVYPDFGCNAEVYTEPGFLEVETLGPLTSLEPESEVAHVEHWKILKDVELPGDDARLASVLKPHVRELLGRTPTWLN